MCERKYVHIPSQYLQSVITSLPFDISINESGFEATAAVGYMSVIKQRKCLAPVTTCPCFAIKTSIYIF